MTEISKLNAENPVELSTVADALKIEDPSDPSGPYEIDPGSSWVTGDATFTCPARGVRCIVTITPVLDDDGEETGAVTVKSVGGQATAMVSPAGQMKLDALVTTIVINEVYDTDNLVFGK